MKRKYQGPWDAAGHRSRSYSSPTPRLMRSVGNTTLAPAEFVGHPYAKPEPLTTFKDQDMTCAVCGLHLCGCVEPGWHAATYSLGLLDADGLELSGGGYERIKLERSQFEIAGAKAVSTTAIHFPFASSPWPVVADVALFSSLTSKPIDVGPILNPVAPKIFEQIFLPVGSVRFDAPKEWREAEPKSAAGGFSFNAPPCSTCGHVKCSCGDLLERVDLLKPSGCDDIEMVVVRVQGDSGCIRITARRANDADALWHYAIVEPNDTALKIQQCWKQLVSGVVAGVMNFNYAPAKRYEEYVAADTLKAGDLVALSPDGTVRRATDADEFKLQVAAVDDAISHALRLDPRDAPLTPFPNYKCGPVPEARRQVSEEARQRIFKDCYAAHFHLKVADQIILRSDGTVRTATASDPVELKYEVVTFAESDFNMGNLCLRKL